MSDMVEGSALGACAVTRVTPAAAGLLSALHAACFDEPWSERVFASLLHLPGGVGFIARSRRAPAGFALVRVAADEAELLTIGVTGGARRAGVGRLLLAHSCAGAMTAGATRIFLDVAESNAAARALYAGAGFAQIGRRRAYYRRVEDALVLARDLKAWPVD